MKLRLMADTETTKSQQRGLVPFKPGQSGNPAGRPKGSRNKLTEDFLGDVLEAWKTSGKTAIAEMIADKPGDFVKMVAGLIPKDVNLNINDTSDMTDDELAQRVRELAAQLAPFLPSGIGDAEAGTGHKASAAITTGVH